MSASLAAVAQDGQPGLVGQDDACRVPSDDVMFVTINRDRSRGSPILYYGPALTVLNHDGNNGRRDAGKQLVGRQRGRCCRALVCYRRLVLWDACPSTSEAVPGQNNDHWSADDDEDADESECPQVSLPDSWRRSAGSSHYPLSVGPNWRRAGGDCIGAAGSGHATGSYRWRLLAGAAAGSLRTGRIFTVRKASGAPSRTSRMK